MWQAEKRSFLAAYQQFIFNYSDLIYFLSDNHVLDRLSMVDQVRAFVRIMFR